jgi:hypothetical protein
MGKKGEKRLEADTRGKKRGKKRKIYSTLPIEDALACPPVSRFFCELVVGNGIGDDAVEDALEAYNRARDSRREKALEAAQKHVPACEKGCDPGEHQIAGPIFGPQDWRIEEDDPKRATTWSWLGFQSVHFCKKH